MYNIAVIDGLKMVTYELYKYNIETRISNVIIFSVN